MAVLPCKIFSAHVGQFLVEGVSEVPYNEIMGEPVSTLDQSGVPCCRHYGRDEPNPGLAMVFSCGDAAAKVISLSDGAIEIGRGHTEALSDPRISRRHARVWFDGQRFWVHDLGSKSGTFVDGRAAPPDHPSEVRRVVRAGDSLFLVSKDVRPLLTHGVRLVYDRVLGPAMQKLLDACAQAAKFGGALHITGESGTGKEMLARCFHDSRPSGDGRFVPVNCAAIPTGLAERLLFGTRRGAYSGADKDAEGYVQTANGGTLFLDEVADLDLDIQAKLLRVLESKEVYPLGASQPVRVDLQICSATNKDLRQQASHGRFREDLYYRIGKPAVSIPPLRKRPEEMAYLAAAVARQVSSKLVVHASLLETCFLLPWPGNVREFLVEVRTAAQVAFAAGCPRVEERHLSSSAGMALSIEGKQGDVAPSGNASKSNPPDLAERNHIDSVLRENGGNMTKSAQALGMHRTQLYRLVEKYGLDQRKYSNKAPMGFDAEE